MRKPICKYIGTAENLWTFLTDPKLFNGEVSVVGVLSVKFVLRVVLQEDHRVITVCL